MKIYLDDFRQAPKGWKAVNWPAEAIHYLKTGKVTEISLDHDLADIFEHPERTGYDVILWMEEAVNNTDFVPPTIHIHSANPVAQIKMNAGIKKIYEIARSKGKIE